jgi:hypothetical protein
MVRCGSGVVYQATVCQGVLRSCVQPEVKTWKPATALAAWRPPGSGSDPHRRRLTAWTYGRAKMKDKSMLSEEYRAPEVLDIQVCIKTDLGSGTCRQSQTDQQPRLVDRLAGGSKGDSSVHARGPGESGVGQGTALLLLVPPECRFGDPSPREGWRLSGAPLGLCGPRSCGDWTVCRRITRHGFHLHIFPWCD